MEHLQHEAAGTADNGTVAADEGIGIFTVDRDLRILSWDGWLERVTGHPAPAMIGRPLAEVYPEVLPRGHLARLRRVVDDGVVELLAPALHRYLLLCPVQASSVRFDCMQQKVQMAPLRENDCIVGAMVSIVDVTLRRERELDLADRLTHPDEAVRIEAARGLAELGGEAVGGMVKAIGDGSWRVRRAAVDGLARHAGHAIIGQLLRAMRSQHRDPSVLNSALAVLAMSDIDVVTPLAELLTDADADIRIYAALALGLQASEKAAPPLLAALADENPNVRFHAIEALGRLRAAEAVEPLLAIAAEDDFFLAFPALDALIRIGDVAVAPRLIPLLDKEFLRGAAIEALGRLGDERVVAALARIVAVDTEATLAAVRALGAIHDRYEVDWGEGEHIAELARAAIDEASCARLVAALQTAIGSDIALLVRVLGWLRAASADTALVALLAQSGMRRELVEALVRHGRRVVPLLIARLEADTEKRAEGSQAAIVALGRIGDPAAVPALLRLLVGDPAQIAIAAGALARIGDQRALDSLLDLLGHADAAVRQAAIAALNSLGHPALPARVRPLLGHSNARIRESAARIVGYFGYEDCLDTLYVLCDDADEDVRRAAAEGIALDDAPRSVARLLLLLTQDTPRVRAAAAQGLMHAPHVKAAPALIAALADDDAWVRYYAAQSIGHHAVPEALPALEHMAREDASIPARVAALHGISRIGGSRATAVLAAAAESDNADVARAALQALGDVAHPDALPLLLLALKSHDAVRRRIAVTALGARGGEQTAGALQWAAAVDDDPAVVQAALEALGRLATPEAIAALVALAANVDCRQGVIGVLAASGKMSLDLVVCGLDHPQVAVRAAVVAALARMRHPEATKRLCAALDDAHAAVRAAAALALGSLGSRVAERRLAVLARDDADPAVRRAAASALQSVAATS